LRGDQRDSTAHRERGAGENTGDPSKKAEVELLDHEEDEEGGEEEARSRF